MKVPTLQHAFDPRHYSELRRRLIRRALRPWLGIDAAEATLARGLDAAEIHSVLICRPNHRLGNLLLITPLVAELQTLLPHAIVDIVLAGSRGPELFRTFANVKHVYCLSRRMVRHPFATSRIALQMRRAHYDLAIDPCEASQSGRLLTALARPKHVLALPRERGHQPQPPACLRAAPVHMAKWPVFLLRTALRHPAPERDMPAMNLRLAVDERARGHETLARLLPGSAPGRATIGIFTEATGAKRLGLDWWHRFLCAVRAARPDLAIIEIVPADRKPRLAPDLPGFGSPSPREVAAVIANLDGFVTADCGVMHLASAAGVPTFALFAASDLARYAPYGHGSRAFPTFGQSPEAIAQAIGVRLDELSTHKRAGNAQRAGRPTDDLSSASARQMTTDAHPTPELGVGP